MISNTYPTVLSFLIIWEFIHFTIFLFQQIFVMNLLLLLLTWKKATVHLNKSGCMPNDSVTNPSGLVFAM